MKRFESLSRENTISSFVLVTIMVMTAIRYNSFSEIISSQATSGYDFFRPFSADTQYFMFWFVIVHYLRLWLGLNYITYDKSLEVAIRFAAKKQKIDLNKFIKLKSYKEFFLRVLLIVFLTTFIFSLSNGNKVFVSIVFLIHAIGIMGYNILYFNEMYCIDKQKRWNYVIFGGDILILFVALLALVLCLGVPIDSYIPLYETLMIAFGIYIFILLLEIITQYAESFWSGIMDMREMFKFINSNNN